MMSQASALRRSKTASSSARREAMKSTASPSARTMRAAYVGPSASVMPSYSPCVMPSAKCQVREALTAIRFGCRSSTAALSTCHWSSPHSSAVRSLLRLPAAGASTGLGAADGLVHAALVGAAERDALHALGAAIEEHVDRAAARGERGGRDERAEDRVLVVLAHRDDPHVHAVLAHERRQRAVHALLEPALLHHRLFAQRAEGAQRIARGHGAPGGRGDGAAARGAGRARARPGRA